MHSIAMAVTGSRGYHIAFVYPPLDNKIDESSASHAGESLEQTFTFGFSQPNLADLMCPRSELCDKPFELTVDDIRFIGFPTLLRFDQSDEKAASLPEWTNFTASNLRLDTDSVHHINQELHVSTVQRHGKEVTVFNVFFVIPTMETESIERVRNVARNISQGLYLSEKLRPGYVAEQIQLFLDIRDNASDSQDLYANLFKKSSIAKELRNIYQLTFPIRNVTAFSTLCGWMRFPVSNVKREHHVEVMPYHSILLLSPPKYVLSQLPRDCHPSLCTVVSECRPWQSLNQLETNSGISITQIIRFATQLCDWDFAITIDMISENSVFLVSPNEPRECIGYIEDEREAINGPIATQFHSLFPFSLFEILNKFNKPLKLSFVLRSIEKRTEFIKALCWLLSKQILIDVKQSISVWGPIKALSERKSIPEFLIPSFNGHVPVESIMWKYNLSREEIMGIVSQNSDLLHCMWIA